jgi:hypothetical protein
MHMNRQGLVSSANRRMRRARRTTGRILVSALGFGVAYYFDVENGGVRRKRLHDALQRAGRSLDSVLTTEVGDPPPVFHPMLRGIPARAPESPGDAPVEAVAR